MARHAPGNACARECGCCQFSRLFSAFGMTASPSMMFLSVLLVLGWYAAGTILDLAWPAGHGAVVTLVDGGVADSELHRFNDAGWAHGPVDTYIAGATAAEGGAARRGVFDTSLFYVRNTLNQGIAAIASARLLSDADGNPGLLGVMRRLVGVPMWMLCMHTVYFVVFALLALGLSSILGGALYRVAALSATRGDDVGVGEAIAYARNNWSAFFLAPLGWPLILVGLFAALCVAGLIIGLPWVGAVLQPLAAAIWFMPLFVGLIMAVGAIAAFMASPMIYPRVAVDREDCFEVWASVNTLVSNRPWKALFFYGVALVFGLICLAIVKLIVRLMFWMAHAAIGAGMNYWTVEEGGAAIGKLDAVWGAPTADTPFWGVLTPTGAAPMTSWFIQAWVLVFVVLVAAWAVSYFASSTTLIYLLLRRDVDGHDMEEVWTESDDPNLFGDSAATQPAATSTVDAGSADNNPDASTAAKTA
jgi:hypothetical protein